MTSFPAADYILAGVFGLIVATTVAGALIAALSTRIIRSVCGLALCCLGLAGLYYFLNSPFLALMEILIYVGAVCVTIVFAIMLAEPDEPAERESRAQEPDLGRLRPAGQRGGFYWRRALGAPGEMAAARPS